jgi:hypothetical protein
MSVGNAGQAGRWSGARKEPPPLTEQEWALLEVARRAGRLRIAARPEGDVRLRAIRLETFGGILDDLEIVNAHRRQRYWRRDPEAGMRVVRTDDSGTWSAVRPKVDCQLPLSERLAEGTVGDGMRAMFVDSSMPTDVIACGNRVDLFGTFDVDEQGGIGATEEAHDYVTNMLVPDVGVLATTEGGVVLAVTRYEQLLLEMARKEGQLDIVLRAADDVLDSPVEANAESVPEKSFREVFREIRIINQPRCCGGRRELPETPPPSDPEETSPDSAADLQIIRGDE